MNTNMEKLAQELEGLAQTQVRREQRPHRAGRSQGKAWALGEGQWLNWGGGETKGRGLRASMREAQCSWQGRRPLQLQF